jgi:hypothetical protein
MKLDRIINESFDLDYDIIMKLTSVKSNNSKIVLDLSSILEQCDQQRKVKENFNQEF